MGDKLGSCPVCGRPSVNGSTHRGCRRFRKSYISLALIAGLLGFGTSTAVDVATAPPAEAAAYYWKYTGGNVAFPCWIRGQEWRRILKGPGTQVQCKVWIYTGRNLTIPPV